MAFTAADHEFMARSLRLAEQGLFTTTPNPRVGCVLVREGVVVGEGWHRKAGEAHAEPLALVEAGAAARGSTAYVTLEPCSHHGRTPPCAEALVAAGVSRVVAAMADPNPLVAGQGFAALRAAGIAVECGLLESEARELNIGFVSRMTRGRPWLRLKAAASVVPFVSVGWYPRSFEEISILANQAGAADRQWQANNQAKKKGTHTGLVARPCFSVTQLHHGRPAFEQVGVQLTADVDPYEQIKLRMLNATHSMLSYPGLLAGYGFVHEATRDPQIGAYLRAFLDRDVIPLLAAPPGMELAAYRDAVLARFANPEVKDQLLRITSDGASKIPVFLGDTLRTCLDAGDDHRRLAFLMAAFARYLRGVDDRGSSFEPIEPKLSAEELALASGPDPVTVLELDAFKGLALTASQPFLDSFARCSSLLDEQGALATLASLDQI